MAENNYECPNCGYDMSQSEPECKYCGSKNPNYKNLLQVLSTFNLILLLV